MDMQTQKLPEPFLVKMGFQPCAYKEALNLEGVCYEPPSKLGEGYYWYYEREGLFIVSKIKNRYRTDLTRSCGVIDIVTLVVLVVAIIPVGITV